MVDFASNTTLSAPPPLVQSKFESLIIERDTAAAAAAAASAAAGDGAYDGDVMRAVGRVMELEAQVVQVRSEG